MGMCPAGNELNWSKQCYLLLWFSSLCHLTSWSLALVHFLSFLSACLTSELCDGSKINQGRLFKAFLLERNVQMHLEWEFPSGVLTLGPRVGFTDTSGMSAVHWVFSCVHNNNFYCSGTKSCHSEPEVQSFLGRGEEQAGAVELRCLQEPVRLSQRIAF